MVIEERSICSFFFSFFFGGGVAKSDYILLLFRIDSMFSKGLF